MHMLEGLPPGVGSHGYGSCVCVNTEHAGPLEPRISMQAATVGTISSPSTTFMRPPRAHQYSCVCVNSGDVGPAGSHISIQYVCQHSDDPPPLGGPACQHRSCGPPGGPDQYP